MKKYVNRGHSRFFAILSVLFIFLIAVSFGVRSYAAKGDLMTLSEMRQPQVETLVITQGMAEIVDVSGAVSDIMVADPSIVDVMALQANRLYVVGANLGSTNIIAVDENGNVVKRLIVQVKFDDSSIQELIDNLFPNEDVKMHTLSDQIVLTGHVSSAVVAAQIANIVARHAQELQGGGGGQPVDSVISNMMTVGGDNQVMLKVKIVEASRNVLRELGLQTSVFEGGGGVGELLQESIVGASGLTADPLGVGTILYNQGADGTGGISMTVRALERDGLINTLAEPNLTAISGESAGFLAGGDFPIPTSRDQDGNIVVTYRPFGVSLNFVPTVLSRDMISLQLATEVSSISAQNSLVTNSLSIPGFNVRRAETTVELASGGSIVIAGLLQSEATKNMNDLPGIKDIPILGDLISSESFQRNETELLVIVTAYLVKPYADKTAAEKVEAVPSKDGKKRSNYALSTAFATNLRRTYGSMGLPDDLFDGNGSYGYLID